jgi:hypothetical protein
LAGLSCQVSWYRLSFRKTLRPKQFFFVSAQHFQLVVIDRAPQAPEERPFDTSLGVLPRIYVLCPLHLGLESKKQADISMILHLLTALESLGDQDVDVIANSSQFNTPDLSEYDQAFVNVKVRGVVIQSHSIKRF